MTSLLIGALMVLAVLITAITLTVYGDWADDEEIPTQVGRHRKETRP